MTGIAFTTKRVALMVAFSHGSRNPRVMAAILRDREEIPGV
jgi:hypothetical protein